MARPSIAAWEEAAAAVSSSPAPGARSTPSRGPVPRASLRDAIDALDWSQTHAALIPNAWNRVRLATFAETWAVPGVWPPADLEEKAEREEAGRAGGVRRRRHPSRAARLRPTTQASRCGCRPTRGTRFIAAAWLGPTSQAFIPDDDEDDDETTTAATIRRESRRMRTRARWRRGGGGAALPRRRARVRRRGRPRVRGGRRGGGRRGRGREATAAGAAAYLRLTRPGARHVTETASEKRALRLRRVAECGRRGGGRRRPRRGAATLQDDDDRVQIAKGPITGGGIPRPRLRRRARRRRRRPRRGARVLRAELAVHARALHRAAWGGARGRERARERRRFGDGVEEGESEALRRRLATRPRTARPANELGEESRGGLLISRVRYHAAFPSRSWSNRAFS